MYRSVRLRDPGKSIHPGHVQAKVRAECGALIEETLEAALKLQRTDHSVVARLGANSVVNFGRKVCIFEARNMALAASMSGLRVSEVYDAWKIEAHSYGDGNDKVPKFAS
nr:hypothetical protein CFP56_38756 [Quercus suber]